jgi:hypothetical protein
MTPKELRAALDELRRNRPRTFHELKAPEVRAKLDGPIAEVAKKNPERVEVRVTARGTDEEPAIISRPRRTEIIQPLEVDSEGRIARANRFDAATGLWNEIEFDGGYRVSEIRHVYDPIARGLNND